MKIVSDFDAGNIDIVSSSATRAELAIRSDSNAEEFRQWFHFQVKGAAAGSSVIEIVNAAECTYPDAWDGYRACVSPDMTRWSRAPTEFDGKTLRIEHRPGAPSVYYAYFAPFSLARHARLIDRAVRSPHARADVVGKTVDGRDLHVVTVGAPEEGRRRVWVIARQHPGETQAEWFAEGMLDRLFDARDEVTRAVLEKAVVHVVPNMNPDGSARGNLRANAAGENLNRAWLVPDVDASPEVAGVRAWMQQEGVDLFLDVHADERNPYCFLAGCEGNPGYNDRLRFLENLFEQSLVTFDEDFQDEYGYDRDEPGGGDLRTAGNWVGEEFDCLSYTVEMPFKDAANHPDPERGWTPERAKRLGKAALESVLVTLDDCR